MNGLPYYKAYPRDFVEGTIGMPFEIKCAYRVVIDLIYMQGGRLPDDARYISGHLGCTIRKWKIIRNELVSLGKLNVIDGFLANYRADNELETLRKLQEKQAENGRAPRKIKGLQKPRLNHTEPEPDIEKTEAKASSKKTTRRIHEDWEPSPDDIAFAISKNLTEEEIQNEADRFRNYWLSEGGAKARKVDWGRTWQNWVTSPFRSGRAMAGNQNTGRSGQGNGLVGAYFRREVG